jgi:two-component system chemotaxis response regulator CheY
MYTFRRVYRSIEREFLVPNANDIKTLLIVDDSRVSRMIIRTCVLQERPNWILLEASSGDEALEIADRDTPNYCTIDINMPGMPGTDAATKILAKYPTTRIVIFSANIQGNQQASASSIGAQFVSKPVTQKSVAQALEFFEGGK